MPQFDHLLPFLIPAAIALVFIAAFWIANHRRRIRTEAFQRVAGELGLTFTPDGSDALHQSLEPFQLFSQGRAKKISNLLRSTSDEREVAVFDYQFVTGHGKTKRRWQNTVVCLRFDGPELPRFVLSPESVWHKVGAWFGAQDIDFEHHEAFSSRYILRGENEPAIRELFNDGVLDFYARNPGLTTEGMSHTLLHYRHNQCVPSDQLRSFLSEALEVLSLYRSHDFSGGGHAAPKNTASSPRE